MVDFVKINGADLAYQLEGPENGPLFITLHGGRGFGDHKSDFEAYCSLSDRCRVLSFDFRGHGQSSRTKPYTFAQLVDDIEGIRKHFTETDAKSVICGGSFGGYLAQQYAIKYPAATSHLILRGTAPSHHLTEEIKDEAKAIATLGERLAMAPCLSIGMLKNKIFGRFESDLEFQLIMHAAAPLYSETFDADKALERCLRTAYCAESHNELYSEHEKYFDYRASLPAVQAKTLIIVGSGDWICPPSESEILASLIPDAKLCIFAEANHSVHLEKNKDVVSEIRRHLDQ